MSSLVCQCAHEILLVISSNKSVFDHIRILHNFYDSGSSAWCFPKLDENVTTVRQ